MRPCLRARRAHGGAGEASAISPGQTVPSALPGRARRVGPQGSSQETRAMYGKHLACASWGLSTCCGQALGAQGRTGQGRPSGPGKEAGRLIDE